eukprot:GEMP01073363.1.p1 GENE.GEMP01073363.1~~GEMP01073363.1.p1  ORF type:complete len:157 (+),score=22.33 GEMP01073363.1:80-550(+)
MRWFLLAVCVLCAKNDYTLHLATDRTDDKVHHAPDKHGEGFLPIRNDNQFLFVGEGSCLSPDKLLILAKPVFHDVTIDPSTEWAVECVNFCLKSSNCAGFTTIQKTRECAVIMANNRAEAAFRGHGSRRQSKWWLAPFQSRRTMAVAFSLPMVVMA